ncbi:MAG: hypothetical protein M1831_002250 [Alyxoria varia]|nr:MAG: hypothetical protein M1831_002250 [Alyxoria varia]
MDGSEKENGDLPALTAQYTSPSISDPQSFRQPVSVSNANPSNTSETTTYLVELKQSMTKLQSEVNAFLTEKMGEDKAQENTNGNKAASNKHRQIDEKKEEDMYGEEADDVEG